MKSDLALMTSKAIDRTKWPTEARICECIYFLGEAIRSTGIIEKYDSSNISLGEASELFTNMNSTRIKDDLQTLANVSGQYTHVLEYNLNKKFTSLQHELIQSLSDLGMLLSRTVWWDRYQQVSDKMGTDCVIALRTAVAMFKADEELHGQEVKKTLSRLNYLTKEVYEKQE